MISSAHEFALLEETSDVDLAVAVEILFAQHHLTVRIESFEAIEDAVAVCVLRLGDESPPRILEHADRRAVGSAQHLDLLNGSVPAEHEVGGGRAGVLTVLPDLASPPPHIAVQRSGAPSAPSSRKTGGPPAVGT